MAKDWDASLKLLISDSPEDFAAWIFGDARVQVKEKLSTEFTSQQLEADALLYIILDGEEALLHIEFQADSDPEMAERLLEYNFRARRKHKRPVYSCVMYLHNGSEVAQSPLHWSFPGNRNVLDFHYQIIELRKLRPDDFRRLGRPALMPLMVLTNGGTTREVAQEIISTLDSAGKNELMPVAFTLASLAFGKDSLADQEWLERMFAMNDILKETPIYKAMTREAREEGRQEGRQEGLQLGLHTALMGIIVERFPKLIRLAKKQMAVIDDPEVLQFLVVKLSVAQTAEEAKQYLLEVDEGEEDE